ncbi:MAG: enoyl-CoA hydratase/isomerase family protein [Antricoccus sp.]
MSDILSVEVRDYVAVLQVHRPPANYFDHELIKQLADLGAELDESNDCRAIVLSSEGKHFCAGANFGEGPMGSDRAATSKKLYTEAVRVFQIKTPMIAAVQGSAVGGGLGLACAADFRVATPSSRLHANFAKLGFHQGFGLSVTLGDIVGQQQAMDMLYTGRRIDGTRAFEMGLVDRLVPDGEQLTAAIAYAGEIAAAAPLAVRSIRETLRGQLAERVRAVLERELSEQSWLWDTADSKEGVTANLERRTATFSGT